MPPPRPPSTNPALASAGSVWVNWVPAGLVTLITCVALIVSSYWPPEQGEMAVVLAPGASEQQVYAAILAAGGRFVAPSRFANIAIAYASDAGFQQRVRGEGALFAVRATGLCAPVAVRSKESPSVT